MGAEGHSPGAPRAPLLVLPGALPGRDVLHHDEAQVALLRTQSPVSVYPDHVGLAPGLPAPAGLGGENIAGDNGTLVPRRLPVGGVGDLAPHVGELSLHRYVYVVVRNEDLIELKGLQVKPPIPPRTSRNGNSDVTGILASLW